MSAASPARRRAAAWLAAALALSAADARAQPPPAVTVEDLAARLQRLEQQNAELAAQNRALARRLEQVEKAAAPPAAPPAEEATPAEPPPAPADPKPPAEPPKYTVGGRDDDLREFVLVRPRDAQKTPFELRVDLWTEARYTNFDRRDGAFLDTTGTPQPVRTFDSLEVTRNFVRFSGFALDPDLQFTTFLFSSTAIDDTVYLGWVNYHFSDAFDVRVGNWLVPGTREWYESFRYTLGADRLMATTFFRPNISPGVWVQGEPVEGLHYVAMLANSLNRFGRGVDRVGSSKAFGGTLRWEPLGDFGLGPSAIENPPEPLVRLGTSLALSRETNQGSIDPTGGNPEDTILRLSDGTPLFRPGALGPGTQLRATNVRLWSLDAAAKWGGFGVSGEYFFRLLDGFAYAGPPSAVGSLFDTGGLVQAGYFVVPALVEAYGRSSFVTGRFGGGNEFGGGVNWFPQGHRDWRFTFEALRVVGSPAQNLLTGYRAGETGTLYQVQWFADF